MSLLLIKQIVLGLSIAESLSQNSLHWISATASLIILGFGLHLSYQAIMTIKDFL